MVVSHFYHNVKLRVEDDLKPPGSLLATDRSKAVVLVYFLLNVFGVGVSCRKLYYFVVYLYVNGS